MAHCFHVISNIVPNYSSVATAFYDITLQGTAASIMRNTITSNRANRIAILNACGSAGNNSIIGNSVANNAYTNFVDAERFVTASYPAPDGINRDV